LTIAQKLEKKSRMQKIFQWRLKQNINSSKSMRVKEKKKHQELKRIAFYLTISH